MTTEQENVQTTEEVTQDQTATETVDTTTQEAETPQDTKTDEKADAVEGDAPEQPKRKAGRPPKKVEDENAGRKIGIFALNEHVQDPTYGTTHSACFDIRVNLRGLYESGTTTVKTFSAQNQPVERKIEVDMDGRLFVSLRPHNRLLAPTGVILDIPEGYSVKVHPRSGTSLKQGINLINQEGVIDADYVEELFLPLVNTSENYVNIYDGERYAQGELQVVEQATFERLTKRPTQKSERNGGFGYTGVK